MIEPLTHYRKSSEFERRLESIALTCVKQREAGEKPDMSFMRAARSMGLDDEDEIIRIRQRAYYRWRGIQSLNSPCIFAEADRIAGLR